MSEQIDWKNICKPNEAHEVYLATARRLGWPIRPDVDLQYEELSVYAQTLDIALCEHFNARFRELLKDAPVVYGPINLIFGHVGWDEKPGMPGSNSHRARLICIEELK